MKDFVGPEQAKYEDFSCIFVIDDKSEGLSTIRKLCGEVEDLQFSYFSFVPWVSTANYATIKTTYMQEWQQLYVKRNYHRIDPIVSSGIWQCRPFTWSELVTGQKEEREFFSEAEQFGIGKSGFSVTACSANNRRGIFSINSRMKEREWQLLLRDHSKDIISFALSYHNNLFSQEAEKLPVLSNRERELDTSKYLLVLRSL